MIQVANYKILKNLMLNVYHPKLVALVIWVLHRVSDFCITSAYREGDGVHGTIPCRAIDIRSKNFNDPEEIASDINNHWVYDPERPKFKCALYHDVGQGPHIHLQCHASTVYLGL